MMDDPELLRRYAESGSEEAFAEIVRRRIGLVYSVALRHTGDAHRAEDVTQAVFAALARKARELARRPVLVGWLYRSAQFAASDAVRVEARRQAREQEVHIMNEIERESPTPDWERLRAVLDDVLGDLAESDRDAVLLRYFDGQPFVEIGVKLRLSENAARMRVERALEKLHAALARRGVKSTAAALGLALAEQAGVAAPAGLAASATAGALAGAASAVGAAGAGGAAAIFMGMTKLQIGIAGALAVAGAAGFVSQGRTNEALRQEIAVVREQQQQVAALKAENRQLASVAAEVEMLRRDDGGLKRLEQQVEEVKRVNEEKARLAHARGRDRERELGEWLAEQTNLAQVEIDRLNREGNELVKHFKALAAQAKDTALAAEARAEADTAAKRKLEEIKAKQREVNEFKRASLRARIEAPEWRELYELRLVTRPEAAKEMIGLGTASATRSEDAANGRTLGVAAPGVEGTVRAVGAQEWEFRKGPAPGTGAGATFVPRP